jgi:hypothetical protein
VPTSRQPRRPPEEPEEPGPPQEAKVEPQTANPDEPRPENEENEITTSSLMRPREIEVDPIQEPQPVPASNGYAVIRMNTTLEDFTYGNPHMHMRLEEGHRYRVPVHIAQYLDGLGYVWH